MSALPLRLALADVLAAITDEPRGHWIARFADPSRRGEPTFVRGAVSMSFAVDRFRAPVRENLTPLTITDPATAYEALISRGVLPDEWAGDVRRAFACATCGGMGHGPGWNGPHACGVCGARGTRSHPPTIPILVAWASLGPAAILRAEELARETVRRLRPWDAPQPERVVWRVGGRRKADSRLDVVDRFHVIHTDGSVSTLHDADAYQPIAEQEREIMEATGTVRDLWRMGLALDSITADAVTIVVPPIGGEA